MVSLIAYFSEIVLRLSQPFLVGFMIQYLNQNPDDKRISDEATIAVGVVFVFTCFIYTALRHQNNVMLQRVGNNVRTSLTLMLFKKATKLSMSSLGETDVGQVVNIMANDLQRFEDLSWFLAFAFVGPIMCVIIIIVTYKCLNWQACIAGILSIVFFIALQGLMGTLFNRFRRATAQITDKRVNKMSELITAMKIIKVYCWEGSFQEVIHDIRKKEMKTLTKTYYLKGINSSFFFIATRIMVFAAFVTFVATDGIMDPVNAFVVLAMYDAIRIPVTAHFPNAIGTGAEAVIATNRCQKILELGERKRILKEIQTEEKGSIKCRNFHGKWTKNLLKENLINLTLDIKPGELLVVVGSVGAGKSCFLYSLLDEIEKISGSCILSGTASYAPQDSWCFGASVRDNILLSSHYDSVKFNKVIQVCGLERDLQLFPGGENTFVGEKGYSLSGGQKARISLARAVYHDSDVYLLDDPLSAVDPKVANHMFRKCIKGYLQKQGRTVVLVTHQLQFLKEADKILVLDEGKMVAFGSYAELLSSNFDFFAHLKSHAAEADVKRKADVPITRSISLKAQSFSESIDEPIDFPDEEPAVRNDSSPREEQSASGAFDPRIYWRFLKASGLYFLMFLSLFLSFLGQGLFQFTDVWFSAWTGKGQNQTATSWGDSYVMGNNDYNIIIYTVLIVVLFAVVFGRTTLTYFVCLASSVNIHNSVFKSLLRAPIAFYESNPLGEFARDSDFLFSHDSLPLSHSLHSQGGS
jgi:ATP-binding cassette subfamily C (CFTR/MRP) protein 4